MRPRFETVLIVAAALTLWGCSDTTSQASAGGGGAGAGTGHGGMPEAGGGGSASDGGGGAGIGGGGGEPAPTVAFVYVGTQAGPIERYELDRDTGGLEAIDTVEVGGNPSFLAASPSHLSLFAVDEANDEVIAFAVDPATGALTELDRKSSEGGGPAYVSVDATGRWVLVANYGGGTVAVLPVLDDGSLDDAVDVEAPGENPHLIRTDPSNTLAFVPCLGSDHVATFAFDSQQGTLTANVPATTLPGGTGPRHLEFHASPSRVYVIGETADTLTTFGLAGDRLSSMETISTLPDGADGSQNFCADLHEHRSGRFLYGSNRGHDSIAVFSIDATTGLPSRVSDVPTGGMWPRNFGLDPGSDIMLVANQNSDTVVTFRIDPETGDLSELSTWPTSSGPSWVGVVTQPLP